MRTIVLMAALWVGACGASSTCGTTPQLGCPCSTSGCMDRLVCSGGTWQTPAIDSCGGLDAGGIRDVGSDANDACDDEGTFYCAGGSGTVCCAGHRVAFEDGPCGLFPDAGEDAGLCPNALGCPCDADAGAAPCLDYTYAVCTGGTWRRGSHACGICSR